MKKVIFFIALSIGFAVHAQKADSTKLKPVKLLFQSDSAESDTMYYDTIREVTVYARKFANWQEEAKFRMLKYRIIKVYPYLVNIRDVYHEVKEMEAGSSKRDFKKYKKAREEQLRGVFEEDIRNLTVGEGKVLVKLINRETGNSFYELMKDLKGNFNAWVYNIIAKKNDYDIKEPYVPEENKDIEEILKNLEEFGSEYEFLNF